MSSHAQPVMPDQALRDRRVLVVEDDPTVREVACDYLRAAGFVVAAVADGVSALRSIERTPPDLVVLDRRLPGIDGLEVCRRLRAAGSIPVLLLTALGAPEERIEGLEAGADDYVVKPLSPRELVLRVTSILRRTITELSPQATFELGDFAIGGSGRRSRTIRRDRDSSRLSGASAIGSTPKGPSRDPGRGAHHDRARHDCGVDRLRMRRLGGPARNSRRIDDGRMSIVVLSAVLSICGSATVIAVGMYLSRHDLVVLIWVIAVSAIVGLGVNALLGVSVARSSARLRSLARAVGAGEVVSAGGTDGAEFSRLAQDLADVSARLADAREQVAAAEAARRQLVAWISHDLRTPLASLRAMTEALADGMADDPPRYLWQMRGQTDVLVSLVDDLFALSTIQSGTPVLAKEPVSLFDLVSDAVADLRLVAARRAVTLRESRTGDLTLWGDPRELSRVIGNLLMNAIEHSPAGGQILVSATETDSGHVSLSVVDEGGGIPEKDLGRIFEPGWRGTQARSPRPVEPAAPGWAWRSCVASSRHTPVGSACATSPVAAGSTSRCLAHRPVAEQRGLRLSPALRMSWRTARYE